MQRTARVLLTCASVCLTLPFARTAGAQSAFAINNTALEPYQLARVPDLVVFFTGLAPDLEGSWYNPRSSALLPNLLMKDPALPMPDVFIVGCRAATWPHDLTVDDLASAAYGVLQNARIFDYHRIVFVGQGVGGLVAERVLDDIGLTNAAALQRIKATVLLATPGDRATTDDLARWLRRDGRLTGLSATTLRDAFTSLRGGRAAIVPASSGATTPWPPIDVAYDTRPSQGIRVSALTYLPTFDAATTTPLDVDYAQLTRPASRESESYQWLRTQVRQALAQR